TATILQMLDGEMPQNWDGRPIHSPRDYLVLSQAAWACQRAVRFANYLCIKTFFDPHHGWPELMLFDISNDPHQQHDLAKQKPNVVSAGLAKLAEWRAAMDIELDPMQTVLSEGGGFYARGKLEKYLERLKKTGRAEAEKKLPEI